MLKRILTFATDKIYNLPIVVLMAHSRCNCRCVMCDIWKANQNKREITAEELNKHIRQFIQLGVREVVLSGGEPLMHSNLWKLCSLLKQNKIRITLLSTGLLLEKNAQEIITSIDEVIVSIDGSEEVHNRIRNIPDGYRKLSDGVKELKKHRSDFKVSARCVLQRFNFSDFSNIVTSARQIGLDRISFLAADVSTAAFNREQGWTDERVAEVALTPVETQEFEKIIERSFVELKEAYETRFIAEHPDKMRKLVQYYYAVSGLKKYPKVICNAPWVSAVIESDGNVLPCFFHKPYGNIYEKDFVSIINSPEAVSFRKHLDMNTDTVCQKCVCSLKLGITQ